MQENPVNHNLSKRSALQHKELIEKIISSVYCIYNIYYNPIYPVIPSKIIYL